MVAHCQDGTLGKTTCSWRCSYSTNLEKRPWGQHPRWQTREDRKTDPTSFGSDEKKEEEKHEPKTTRTAQGTFRGMRVGDAEKPGPRVKRKSKEVIQVKAWTINCQGREGAEAVLEAAANSEIEVVALHEVQMTKKGEAKFATSAALKGYRCYHQEGQPGALRTSGKLLDPDGRSHLAGVDNDTFETGGSMLWHRRTSYLRVGSGVYHCIHLRST